MFLHRGVPLDDRNSLKEHDFELILQFYTDLIARKTSQPLDGELHFLLEMYCQGSVYMTVKWVLGGMKDSRSRWPGPWWKPCRPSWRRCSEGWNFSEPRQFRRRLLYLA